MTSGKYRTVLQNEKCVNDAILSVLANLHRAARKKNDFIWSPYKFDSLKSIWGDDTETKTNKIDSEASDDQGHAKTSLTPKGNDMNIQANAVEMQGSCEKETGELSFQVGCKVPEEKSDRDVFRKGQETFKSIHKYIFETYHQNHSELKTLSDRKSLESRPKLINDRQNQPELSKDISRLSVQYSAPNKRSFSKENSLPKETNVVEPMSCKEFDDVRTRHVDNGLIHHLPQSVLTMTETSYPSKDSTSSDDDNDETKSKLSSISKPRRIQKTSKQFINIMSIITKHNALSSKRNRDDSDSSTGSLVKPLQKKIAGKTEDINQNCKDKEDNYNRTLLSVKVMQDDHFYEITINESDFDRVRKKYPKLREEVLPDTDAFEKEVPYCAGAVKIIIGFLFHPPFDSSAIPDGRTSVEILAATKAWAIQQFHDNFQLHFVKKITESNFRVIYSLARHFGLHQICSACKVFLPEGESLNNRRSYKLRKCFIAVSRYIEPLELCIPLGTAEQLLNDNFDRDIRNTVVFEAITKDFNVAGFQIILDASNSNINETSATLDIFYSTKLTNSSADPEEIKLSRPFRPNIAIYFKRNVVVKKHEKMQISVETTIKPYLCFETYENFIKTSNDAEFSLTVESTYRVKNSGGKRFIIGKLLYNPIDEI